MAKRMKKGKGKHAATCSKQKRIIISLALLVLMSALILEASFGFFSDGIISIANAITGNVKITVSDVLIEEEDIVNRPDEEAIFGTEVPLWTVGDINNFKWTVTNTGKSAVKLTNRLRIAWDTAEDLNVQDVIYVYPTNVSDEEIRTDITANNASGAIISYATGETEFEYKNGDDRKGFEVTLEDIIDQVYLDSSIVGGQKTSLSGNQSSHTYEFKIVFGVRPNTGQMISYFNKFNGRNLKIEIETKGNLLKENTRWIDTKYENIMLKNATVDPEHPIFDMYDNTPPVITLKGDNPKVINRGTEYIEPGYTAIDDVDGDITSNVIVIGNMDNMATGEYILIYTVKDSSNNVSVVTRKIIVVNGGMEDFDYTGEYEEYIIPATGKYIIEAWGASGGDVQYTTYYWYGGGGAYAKGEFEFTAGEKLYIRAGGEGRSAQVNQVAAGGFNGGGDGGKGTNASYFSGGSGGGASDVRIGNDSLSKRIVVAAGGGGAAYGENITNSIAGGYGGTLTGGLGTYLNNYGSRIGKGGTQAGPGAGGTGGTTTSGFAGILNIGGNGASGAAGGGRWWWRLLWRRRPVLMEPNVLVQVAAAHHMCREERDAQVQSQDM